VQAGANAAMVRKMQHRQRVLDEMVRVQRSLARRAPFQEKLDLVTAAVARVLDVELVAIRLVDQERSDELVVVSGVGLDPDAPRHSPVTGSGVGGAAFRSNGFVSVDDYTDHEAAMPEYRIGGVRAAMATPVQQFGRAVGSIVAATVTAGRRFGDTDREALRAFADQASIALTEQHLYTEMQQGFIDPLTGLANRARLHDQLTTALELTTGLGAGPAVLFVDLDGFKLVNDALGHGIGDELLVRVAERLRDVVAAPFLVARFGGDEFTVLLPAIEDLAVATRTAGNLLAALEPRFDVSGHDVSVSASIGIAWDRRRPDNAADAAVDMMRCADTAMYRAKASGRGRYAVFEDRMHDELVRSMARERNLRRAVEQHELTTHFQPIVDLTTGACVGAEALVRWNRNGELVPPAQFISLAEDTGLIVGLGQQVLRSACEVVASWAADGLERMTMSVNLSVRELENPNLVEDVRAELERSGAPASSIVIELTESALMRDVELMTERLVALRGLGVRIAIDDFGTGYSSLSRLRWLPIDILKIDRSFVGLVDTDPHSHAMLRAVQQLALALDLQVVVEGVEREGQVEALKALGFSWAQGYLFSPAVPADRLRGLLRGPARRGLPQPVPAWTAALR
jgi:diguanylate cyclase (GGDEF)-like protein